jgi:hypothetical protein
VLDIYYDILKISINNSNIKYFEWFDDIKDISKLNNLDGILKKIDILLNAKDSVKFNVNCNLLFDSIILSIGGINNGSRY